MKSIHKKFENIADGMAARVAVKEMSRSMIYGQLNREADRIAETLRGLGVQKENVIAVYLNSSIEYVVAVLAILKVGGVFLPLNVKFPEKRLKSILRKTKPFLFITNRYFKMEFLSKCLPQDLDIHSSQVIFIDEPSNANNKTLDGQGSIKTTNRATISNRVSTEENNGCYIMTTSGSTGEPKAILGTNEGLSHFIAWEVDEFKIDEHVRTGLLSQITFDVSLRDIFVPLTTGGTLCIPDEDSRTNPGKLADWLRNEKISLVHIVPTVFRMLIREMELRGKEPIAFPELRLILIAGEVLFGNDVSNWRRVCGKRAELVNVYGPSETTLAKFYYRIPEDDRTGPSEIIPVGRPLPGTEFVVLNRQQACSIGEIGEIYIKTPYGSKGYYNDPELTNQSFVPHPVSGDPTDVFYKTGDLGKIRPDFNVCVVGRADHQVKIYGNRVELSEVEAVLLENPGIKQAVVAAKPDGFGNLRLIAYLVPRNEGALGVESLKRFTENLLPDYMVPSLFITLENLPLTPNQKVDRQALPEPGRSRPLLDQPYVSASGNLEKELSALWCRVLNLDDVGVNDNFFDLGGTSILCVHLLAGIKERMNLDFPIVKIFQYPTVRLLAAFLAGTPQEQPSSDDNLERSRQRKQALFQRKTVRQRSST